MASLEVLAKMDFSLDNVMTDNIMFLWAEGGQLIKDLLISQNLRLCLIFLTR